MPVQTKRKTTVKKETIATYERLRLRHWVMFWVLVAATHALVIAIFSNVDVKTLMPVGSTSSTSAAEEQLIDELRGQVKSLGDKVASVEEPQAEGRIMANAKDVQWRDLYLSNQGELPADCGVLQLNTTTATQTYLWYDQSTGIQAELPYSFAWGNDRYFPTPYEQVNSSTISFGPFVIAYQGCAVGREAELTFGESADPNPVLREIRNNADLVGPVRQRIINGITVLSYRIEALGYGDIWDVFGRSYRYTIKGSLSDAEAMSVIQSLRVTK